MRSVDYFAIEQRHQTFQVFYLLSGDGVEVAVPHRNVGSFAHLEGTDLIFEKHLARTPVGVAAEGGVDIHTFGDPKGLQAITAFGSLAHYAGPESKAGRHWGDEVVRPTGPQNTSGLQGPEGLQPLPRLGP